MSENDDPFGGATAFESSDSEFVAVVFHSIQECYPPELKIECRYTIKPTVKPAARDWIGVFRVGWQSLREYLTYEWSPMSVVNDGDGKPISKRVVFPGKSIPKSDDEFYQFCYVTSGGEIRGASVPFQIKTKVAEPDLECCEIEDEDGTTMLLVKNKTAILEEQLSRALDENATVKASKETIATELRNSNERILRLENQKVDLTSFVKELQENNETITAEVGTLRKSLEEKNQELDRECMAREESERKASELESKNQDLMVSLDSANKRAEEFGKLLEAERLQNTEVQLNTQKLVVEKNQYLDAMAGDRKVIENLTKDLIARDEEIRVLEQQITVLKKTAKTVLAASKEKENQIEKLEEGLEKQHQDFEKYKQQLEGEVKKGTEKINEMYAEFKTKEKEIADLELTKNAIKQELAMEQLQVEKLRKDAEQDSALVVSNIQALKEELQEKQEVINKMEYEMEDMSSKLSEEKDKNSALEEDYESVVRVLEEQLEGERAFNKSLCSQSDRNAAELEEKFYRQLALNEEMAQQLETKSSDTKKLEEEVQSCRKQIESYEQRVGMAWKQITAADAEVKSLQREKESLQTALNDTKGANMKSSKNSAASMYALQMAHADLKKKYLQSQKEKEELWRERNELKKVIAAFQQSLPSDDLRNQIEDLRAKNEDLRVRLNMGAEAYKVKFVECRRLQSQMKKLQRGVSTDSSVSEASISDVQSVVSKLRQALDDEKQLAVGIKKALEDEKELALQRNKEIEELRQENMELKLRVEDVVIAEAVQQNQAAEQASLEQLQAQVESLQTDLDTKDTRLINMERAFTTEKAEKESLVHEIVNLQVELNQREEMSFALAKEQEEREQLGEEAREKLLRHQEREKELEKKVVKLEDEIQRWKREVKMYVEAERKFVETFEEEVKHEGEQDNQQQQQNQQQEQRKNSFCEQWFRRLREARYPPNGRWSPEQKQWVWLERPEVPPPQPFSPLPPVAQGNQPWAHLPQQPTAQAPPQPSIENPLPASDTARSLEIPDQQEAPATVPVLVADCSVPNRECPVCRVLWPPGDDIIEFERHVNNHFSTN